MRIYSKHSLCWVATAIYLLICCSNSNLICGVSHSHRGLGITDTFYHNVSKYFSLNYCIEGLEPGICLVNIRANSQPGEYGQGGFEMSGLRKSIRDTCVDGGCEVVEKINDLQNY